MYVCVLGNFKCIRLPDYTSTLSLNFSCILVYIFDFAKYLTVIECSSFMMSRLITKLSIINLEFTLKNKCISHLNIMVYKLKKAWIYITKNKLIKNKTSILTLTWPQQKLTLNNYNIKSSMEENSFLK